MQGTFDNLTAWSAEEDEEAANRKVELFINMLQAHTGGPYGYRLRRIILTNFWLYGQQEFEIPHGRLFLAGENASGKSTVLTAALPLALDGDLRPNRLDTFGGRERHIEYYVLGSTASATPFSHERRTAYIAMEFEWCDPNSPPVAQELRQLWENGEREKARFLTIGLSIVGNANATDRIRPLRFLITDGSRLGYDLHTLYETGNKQEKRALDHIRFKQMLEGHGIICDTQAEYERQVARYLFGFPNEKDFQKLINLLLVLRRPNLSSELNFSRVHEYLKQSLPKISDETTRRVIGTIERIDAITSEIERIQEAYDATDRLHRAGQNLALVRAQLAACEYIAAQLVEDNAASRETKLRKDLFTADTERKRAQELSQALQTEQYQVSSQIKLLESSDGLQVAQRLTDTRERARETEAQMRLQEQSLEAARNAIHENSEGRERQLLRFEKVKMETAAHLRELRSLAADECYWETAALQLEEAESQLTSISEENTPSPDMPFHVTSLIEEQSEERISWLSHLGELHLQREKLEDGVQHARTLETTRFQELDDVRRRFQSVQDRAYEAQENLNKTLEQFMTGTQRQEHITESFIDIMDGQQEYDQAGRSKSVFHDEGSHFQSGMANDESLTGKVVEQFAATLNSYRQAIDALENELTEVADEMQSELDDLQLLIGSKMHEIEEIGRLYEQKQSEPEFTPQHSTRRTIARAKLAEQGIVARPLYALLDFAPNIDSDEAGRIEYMLEDAGLLDALIVAPAQISTADALLAAEGLSDCRLDIGESSFTFLSETHTCSGMCGLCFDRTLNDSPDGSNVDWEAMATALLTVIGPRTHQCERTGAKVRFSGNEDGTWRHGLLAGQAGRGSATYIGKATRIRARQRELATLDKKRSQLGEELKRLTQQFVNYQQQQEQLHEKQAQLHNTLANSGLEEIYAELAQVKVTLDDARSKYAKARLQTQEAKESRNTLLSHLERESKGIGPLASDSKRVQNSLMGVVKLKNSIRSLQIQMTNLIHAREEYHKARESLEKSKANEDSASRLYERARYLALRAKAEEEELQRIAELADMEELINRLRLLREQNESLSPELDKAKESYTRADERARNTEYHLSEAQIHLQKAQEDRSEKQVRFVELLTAYPVEQLVEIHQIAIGGDYVNAGRKTISVAETMSDGDISALKEHLERGYREAYSFLARTFNQEQPLLLEYGPDLDDFGYVRFLHENKSQPVDLLEVLSERIEMQKTLLGQQERQLFEDFLLQEIAEAIRTHILDAEEWVQQINSVLSGLPMIGEHYALQWKLSDEYDPTKLGNHLAQHYKLLRKSAQTLTAEETETLMAAFRQEIETVRIRQQENPETNFMEALEQVFDYREWFHFDVWVTPVGGQRQRLTDRVAGTRSGAEQLFALYVPLFAALSALYRSAAPGAPRLLALDEAFDKVSVANTQRIMEFLVSQEFQWIMTGPQISGTGAKIPACARYLMIHEKGSPIATASASFWSDCHDLQSIQEK
jgi:uncharacterized protein (TIGR02680 family)